MLPRRATLARLGINGRKYKTPPYTLFNKDNIYTPPSTMIKRCSKCKQSKPFDMFSKDKRANDGFCCACKECRKKKDDQYKKRGGHLKQINQDDKPWFECSKCIAVIGFGHKKAAKILSHLTLGQIYTAWRRGGVAVNAPACGSWRIYASRAAKGIPTDRMRTQAEILYEKARMQDIKANAKWGFTWIYEWRKVQANRKALEKYHAMTPEEKREHNKRCAANHKKRMENNPEARLASQKYHKKWKKKNKDKCREYIKKSVRKNPEKYKQANKEYRKKRAERDPSFKMQQNMRKRYRDIMKSTKNGGSTRHIDDLGCSTKEFNHYLESKFTKGMTWDNYGTYWHLDHILPCASFDHEDEKQRKQCWHWTNFQPLEAVKNMEKSDNIEKPQMKLLFEYA